MLQWLPNHIKYQWIYLVFRWVMAAYFFGWLIPSGLIEENGGVKYFIFLTNWCYLAWNVYLIASAISVTVKVILVYCYPSCASRGAGTTTASLLESPKPHIDIDVPIGCCGRGEDATSWYQKIQWLLYYFGVHMAVTVCILYWALLYNGGPVDGVNIHTHLLNGIIAVIDVLFSGVPVRFLHFIYPVLFGIVYAVFTGIYFAAGGTNAVGDPYVYRVLDYGNSPGTATAYVVAVVVVFIPIVHLLLFGLYSMRFWISCYIWSRRESSATASSSTEMN